jgi:hypothetical protein
LFARLTESCAKNYEMKATSMGGATGFNDRGNHQGEFSQGVGGWAEYTVYMTETADKVRHDVRVPPGKVIPVIFLPGVMGSNLRMSKRRQKELERDDNRAWRPDDMVSSWPRKAAVGVKLGLGGWFRNASPAQRQLVFDPNETEVEYYHYTEDRGRFDPEGKETLAADARHQNVPDNLEQIPPLIRSHARPAGASGTSKKYETAAQVARWRGWSEVLFDGAYGQMLRTAERALNNMARGEVIDPYGIWKPRYYDTELFSKSSGLDVKPDELKKIANCWYPVHAMGYNFLKSNGESAKVIAERIRGLVIGYEQRGFKCDEVIIATHSMGGLVGRALIHPKYGNLGNDPKIKVLGIYHSAMPTMGAAAAYRRMRFGFQEQDGAEAAILAEVIAKDGENATAILANTPAPLEMLPARGYGKEWLKVVDGQGKTICSWPPTQESALTSIYLQPASKWWRLVNPDWVNPGRVKDKDGGGMANVKTRLSNATAFLDSIESTFHPNNSYASFCASEEHKSYGELVFKVMDPEVSDWNNIALPPADTWVLAKDDKKGTLKVQAGPRVLTLQLQPPQATGDETVPSERSACKVRGILFSHGTVKGSGYEHQKSYAHPNVLTAMLYSIVKIAATAKWN